MIQDELLHKWLNQSMNKEELAEFRKRPEYEELAAIYKKTEDLQGPTFDANLMLKEILGTEKEAIKENLNIRNIEEAEPASKPIKKMPVWMKLVTAASVVFVLGYLFFPQSDAVEFATNAGKSETITLPDGSVCDLQENSHLTYGKKSWLGKREVHLRGSATFKVEKGSTFTVLTANGKVEVLGTIFTVEVNDDFLNVLCSEGKVSVSNLNESIKQIITANETASIIDNRQMLIKQKNNTKLENVSIAKIIEELEQTFKIKVEAKGIDVNEEMTVNFQHKDLDVALKTAFPNFNANKIGGKVFIQPK